MSDSDSLGSESFNSKLSLPEFLGIVTRNDFVETFASSSRSVSFVMAELLNPPDLQTHFLFAEVFGSGTDVVLHAQVP